MNKNVTLIIVGILIFVSILYLEGQKIKPPDIIPEQENTAAEAQKGALEDSGEVAQAQGDEDSRSVEVEKKGTLSSILKATKYKKAPELTGIVGYINTDDDISIKELNAEGKIVLIDFWTYTCINCIRTFPYLRDWHEKYEDKGLVIIGVHTPEFTFEKKYENVVAAAEKYDLDHAIVQDNDYATWRAFKNSYWPRKYLIDTDGYIRYDHIGEGAYEETERKIQELLVEIGVEEVRGAETVKEDIKNYLGRIRRTPELYAGFGFALTRFQNLGNQEGFQRLETHEYNAPASIVEDTIYLEGSWYSNEDHLEAKEADTSILLDFSGAEVNIVAEPLGDDGKLYVLFDDSPITEAFAGDDVEFEEGEAFIAIDMPRMYNVVSGDQGRHTINLTSDTEGFSFHAFTFG